MALHKSDDLEQFNLRPGTSCKLYVFKKKKIKQI